MLWSLGPRQRQLLQVLLRDGQASRRDLHERTGIRPNTIGADASHLIELGIIRELPGHRIGRGRPKVPLEIDPESRHVLGIAISADQIEVQELNLRGEALGDVHRIAVRSIEQAVETAAERVRQQMSDRVIGVGICTSRTMDSADLRVLIDAAGQVPVIRGQGVGATAAQWMLQHPQAHREHVLLVSFADQQIAACLLTEGRPSHGSLTISHELGHFRFPIETDLCHCGKSGCLEQIFSTRWLHRLSAHRGTLTERAAALADDDEPMRRLMDLLAMGISNAANLTRPSRLLLSSDLLHHHRFAGRLTDAIRDMLIGHPGSELAIDLLTEMLDTSAVCAGHLALVNLFYEGWGHRPRGGATLPRGANPSGRPAER